MSGHVAPWCLGCGLDAHDPTLFDLAGDPIFDDTNFDIGVIADRLGGQMQSTDDLMRVFGVGRQWIHRAMVSGLLMRPTIPGKQSEQSYWDVREIAAIVLAGGMPKGNKTAACGTIAAYRRHIRHRERIDSLCARAAAAYRRDHRK